AVKTIEAATISPDGTITSFAKQAAGMATARASHATAVVGNYVYMLGGFYGGTASSIERATIAADGSLGTFAVVAGVNLSTPRTSHIALVLGKYLYAVGGKDTADVALLASIDRVALNDD